MPTFLSDPPFAVYALLLLGVIVAFGVWVNNRQRVSLMVFVSLVALLIAVFSIDRLFESPREESIRRVQEMAKAIDSRNTDAFLGNIADKLEYLGESTQPTSISREDLRKAGMWSVLKQHNVHVAAWDFAREDVTVVDEGTIEIGFLGKAEVEGTQAPMYFRASFTRQPDGQMKLSKLASFDPVKRTNERKSIPNFP